MSNALGTITPNPRENADLLSIAKLRVSRRTEPEGKLVVGPTAAQLLVVCERVLETRKSEVALVWPQPIDDPTILHALLALSRMRACAERRLATLFFPWGRNTGASEKSLLVDRDALVRATLPELGRIVSEKPQNPAFGYLMALHSLKHLLTSGKKNKRLKAALESSPALVQPSLFEIMPQIGVRESTVRSYDGEFLGRLRRHTWIDGQLEHLNAAESAVQSPFFCVGIHPDATRLRRWRESDLDPGRGGRLPQLALLDLTQRARRRLGATWRPAVKRFLDVSSELYATSAPAVVALTDDVFALQALRFELLKEYDVRRGVSTPNKKPVLARAVLSARADPFEQEVIVEGTLAEVSAEVFDTDLLSFVEHGYRLKRALADARETNLAEAVGSAIDVLQNLVGLPGPPRQLQEFLNAHYEGFELQAKGVRYDHLTPRGILKDAVKQGAAGALQKQLVEFLDAFDRLGAAAAERNPGHALFDDCLKKLTHKGTRSIVVFSSELLRSFAEWRIETEDSLADVRRYVGRKIRLVDRREAIEELEFNRTDQQLLRRIVFIDPRPEDFLHVLTRPWLPKKVVVIAHLARVEHVLRRLQLLLQLEGIEPVRNKLTAVEQEFKRVIAGRSIDMPDVDAAPPPPRLGTLDLTIGVGQGGGPTRIITASGQVRVRAYDGSSFAVYDRDALQPFTRKLAKTLAPGDQICIFSDDFVEAARERLSLTTNASDVLVLYHRAVAEAAEQLPGADISSKARALRDRIVQVNAVPDFPGIQSVRGWIDVRGLIDAPRHEVRPQAPGDRRNYLLFMKALGIADEMARHYWDLGVFWTRSMRISKGAEFHQVFMSILVDPFGASSKLPARIRAEVWRISEMAEQYTVRVISNQREGE